MQETRVKNDEDGQTLIEYVLIVALVSVALIASLLALTGALGPFYDSIISKL